MGDALVRLVITNGVDVPAICNVKRTIPAAIGAALLERDPICVVPGCDQSRPPPDRPLADRLRRRRAAHQWWNLVRLCTHHHDLKTRGLFRLEGGPGDWRFVRNAGGTTGATRTTGRATPTGKGTPTGRSGLDRRSTPTGRLGRAGKVEPSGTDPRVPIPHRRCSPTPSASGAPLVRSTTVMASNCWRSSTAPAPPNSEYGVPTRRKGPEGPNPAAESPSTKTRPAGRARRSPSTGWPSRAPGKNSSTSGPRHVNQNSTCEPSSQWNE